MKRFPVATTALILLVATFIYGCTQTSETQISTLPSKVELSNGAVFTCMGGVTVLVQNNQDVAYKCYTTSTRTFIKFEAHSVKSVTF